jgi:CBS domain-containing protein
MHWVSPASAENPKYAQIRVGLLESRRPAASSRPAFPRESAAAMPPVVIFNREFEKLRDVDTVADATRRMLAHRVSDLPVVDANGTFIGMFKLERLLAALLPAAALVGYGMPDLSFVSDDLDSLCEKMHAIDARPVGEFAVMPESVVHPDTPPLEIVLQLYRGANNLPVVEREGGRLVGVVSARDVLAVLHAKEKH